MANDKKTPLVKKNLKVSDLRALDAKKLVTEVIKIRLEATALKRDTLMGDVQNVHAHKMKRRQLARTLTILNQVKEVK